MSSALWSTTTIPLNEGCLKPIEISCRRRCLNPKRGAAVVAGNVETSQIVVDALYGALGALAASQGTMNNFTFGDDERQYYETICGGAGAGPGFDGASVVQTHMTNSRLTDPEVLEARFPCSARTFAVRHGSGGAGAHHGGDGAVRAVRFREPMTGGDPVQPPPRGAVRAGRRRGWRALAPQRVSARTDSVETLAATAATNDAPGRRVRDRNAGRRRLWHAWPGVPGQRGAAIRGVRNGELTGPIHPTMAEIEATRAVIKHFSAGNS